MFRSQNVDLKMTSKKECNSSLCSLLRNPRVKSRVPRFSKKVWFRFSYVLALDAGTGIVWPEHWISHQNCTCCHLNVRNFPDSRPKNYHFLSYISIVGFSKFLMHLNKFFIGLHNPPQNFPNFNRKHPQQPPIKLNYNCRKHLNNFPKKPQQSADFLRSVLQSANLSIFIRSVCESIRHVDEETKNMRNQGGLACQGKITEKKQEKSKK